MVMEHNDLRQRAWDAAASVCDPEIPGLSIADLGVLRDVAVSGNEVEVAITSTYSGCPAMDWIARDVQSALDRAGIAGRVRTALAPAWTSDWITAEGRRVLAANGIVPPTRAEFACPRCGSATTERISEFGSTPCKALWRCLACGEPFDVFKCH
jgi:ring-1,2-phenylacetyl-CoA epoxidase subunit PaaD